MGKETAQILYSKNAKVYIAARSEEKVERAIASIKAFHPASEGELVFLNLDLNDFANVKKAAERFLSQETKLHVLFNNAAVQAMEDVKGSVKTVQGHEVHLGVNVLAPFLFTKLLTPILVATAQVEEPGTVRVVWVSSMGLEAIGEKSMGLSLDYPNYWPLMSPLERYGLSKAGNWLHGVEFATRYKAEGVISIPCNPGHLASDLYRESGRLFKFALKVLALFPPIYGAYVELFSGLSSTLTLNQSGQYGELNLYLFCPFDRLLMSV